jgi:hypothetical protein
VGRAGSAPDDAICEGLVASSKRELLFMMGNRFRRRRAARIAIFFEYIEGFYERLRRHSSFSYVSPSDYEQATIEEVAVA